MRCTILLYDYYYLVWRTTRLFCQSEFALAFSYTICHLKRAASLKTKTKKQNPLRQVIGYKKKKKKNVTDMAQLKQQKLLAYRCRSADRRTRLSLRGGPG